MKAEDALDKLEAEARKCYESVVKKKPDLQTLTPRVTREEHEILLRWADGRPLSRMIIKAALKAAAEAEKRT